MKEDIKLWMPEKLVRINPHFVTVLIGCFILLAITMAYLFVTSSPKRVEHKPEEIQNKVSADEMITAILREDAKSPQVTAISEAAHKADVTVAYRNMSNHQFEAAGEAAISVYHAVDRQPEAMQIASRDVPSFQSVQTGDSQRSSYDTQNGQADKNAFLNSQQGASQSVSMQRVHRAISPYQINAGTILPATLLTGINSDLPNQITAKIRRPIYDSVTGNYLLVPQGTTVIGTYDSKITYGQRRVLVAWNRMIFPNGSSLDIEGQPGADLAGMAGLSDTVDNHTLKLFGSVAMMSLFGAAGQLSQPQNNGVAQSNAQVIYGAIGQQVSQTAAQLISKQMNIQPTIMIRPGMNFTVLLTRDFVFPGPYRFASK